MPKGESATHPVLVETVITDQRGIRLPEVTRRSAARVSRIVDRLIAVGVQSIRALRVLNGQDAVRGSAEMALARPPIRSPTPRVDRLPNWLRPSTRPRSVRPGRRTCGVAPGGDCRRASRQPRSRKGEECFLEASEPGADHRACPGLDCAASGAFPTATATAVPAVPSTEGGGVARPGRNVVVPPMPADDGTGAEFEFRRP